MNFNIIGTFALNVASESPPPTKGKVFLAAMLDGFTITGDAETMDTGMGAMSDGGPRASPAASGR